MASWWGIIAPAMNGFDVIIQSKQVLFHFFLVMIEIVLIQETALKCFLEQGFCDQHLPFAFVDVFQLFGALVLPVT